MKRIIFIFRLFFCLPVEIEDAPKTFDMPINHERRILELEVLSFELRKKGGRNASNC